MLPERMESPWPERAGPGSVALLGLPWDGSSSSYRGPAEAPARVRAALLSLAGNLNAESGLDLGTEPRMADVGDLELEPAGWIDTIEAEVSRLLDSGAHVLGLGGDHAVTLPIVRAYAARHRPLSLLLLDAHPDLYDELDGDRLSHACPFARIMEEGLVERLVQVGIRSPGAHEREQAERFGVEMVRMPDWRDAADLRLTGPLYLSLDLDVLDPAFAPGTSHREPGGASVREVLALLSDVEVPVIGADVVELNPRRDVDRTTEGVAAKLVKEVAALMLRTTLT